jgi:hypothetical protein
VSYIYFAAGFIGGLGFGALSIIAYGMWSATNPHQSTEDRVKFIAGVMRGRHGH